MQDQDYKNISLYTAILGWLAFIIAVAVYLFVMKPYYYQQGIEAGRQQQFLSDVEVIDDYLLLPRQEPGAQNPYYGKVTEVAQNEIRFENITGTYNPLLVSGDVQYAVLSPETTLQRRSLRTEEEVLRLQEEAQLQGEDPNLVSPYVDEEISLLDIQEGDRIEVLPASFGEGSNEYFVASTILLLDLEGVEFGY